jgi:hypothetical protein
MASYDADTAQEQEEEAPQPYIARDTDTAALLRELSSLGLDDEPSPVAPASPRPPRPAPAGAGPRKKKGLFSR